MPEHAITIELSRAQIGRVLRTSRSVTEVAHELNINGSTSHRYISTLVMAGLLERDPISREYRLRARDNTPG
jgi:DNA-binding IclR family transcriptional regulator